MEIKLRLWICHTRPPVQRTGNLHGGGGVFLCPVHAGTGSSFHDPKWDYVCGENGRMNVSFNVLNLYFTMNWPLEQVEQLSQLNGKHTEPSTGFM